MSYQASACPKFVNSKLKTNGFPLCCGHDGTAWTDLVCVTWSWKTADHESRHEWIQPPNACICLLFSHVILFNDHFLMPFTYMWFHVNYDVICTDDLHVVISRPIPAVQAGSGTERLEEAARWGLFWCDFVHPKWLREDWYFLFVYPAIYLIHMDLPVWFDMIQPDLVNTKSKSSIGSGWVGLAHGAAPIAHTARTRLVIARDSWWK